LLAVYRLLVRVHGRGLDLVGIEGDLLGGCGLAGYLVLLRLQGLWMLSTVVFLYVYLKVDQSILVFVFILVFA